MVDMTSTHNAFQADPVRPVDAPHDALDTELQDDLDTELDEPGDFDLDDELAETEDWESGYADDADDDEDPESTGDYDLAEMEGSGLG